MRGGPQGDVPPLLAQPVCVARLAAPHEFNAKTRTTSTAKAHALAWEDLIPVDGTFVVDAPVHSEVFTHDHFAACV